MVVHLLFQEAIDVNWTDKDRQSLRFQFRITKTKNNKKINESNNKKEKKVISWLFLKKPIVLLYK